MADEHHAPFKLVDGLRQRVDGLDVQVIGGLVEEQHVRVLPGQPGEAHAALLAVRQVPDGADLSGRGAQRTFSLLSPSFLTEDVDVALSAPQTYLLFTGQSVATDNLPHLLFFFDLWETLHHVLQRRQVKLQLLRQMLPYKQNVRDIR